MKIYVKLNLLFCFIVLKSIGQQTNEFKIGMFGASFKYINVGGCEVPYTTPLDQNLNKTSSLNVIAEDGFNIFQTYSPNEWESEEALKNKILLAGSNNMKVEVSAGHFYKPAVDLNGNYLGYGTNVFNNCGFSISPCQNPYSRGYFRANINNFINNIYKLTPYREIIWGYHVSEESSFNQNHFYHFANNCYGNIFKNPNYFKSVEIPPININDAILYYKNTLALSGITNHKTVIMEAFHHKNINANTFDGVGIYNPQDYIQLLDKSDKRDIFFEGSYTQFNPTAWLTQNYNNMFNNGDHYLGAFKSIDYAKIYANEVHKVINIEGTSVDTNYLAHYHTNISVPNANWLWFQAYTSIIHGAKGIWFWDFNYHLNDCEEVKILLQNGINLTDIINKAKQICPELISFENEQITCESNLVVNCNGVNKSIKSILIEATNQIKKSLPNCFEKSFFGSNYRNFIGNLSKELRFLVDKNIISTDESNIIYQKTDHQDFNCIVPADLSYIPTSLPPEKRTENYGLRYTIRSNGTETYMIVVNPLNVAVTVSLDFSKSSNPLIQNSTGVNVLFENNQFSVTSNSYKVDRQSNIDLNSGTIGNQYYLGYSQNKSLNISFGPMDVKVLKFVSNTNNTNNGWSLNWSNLGNNKINGHAISDGDLFYKGDFDGDGNEELLCVGYKPNGLDDWISLLKYENDNWQWVWSNYGNSNVGNGIYPYRNNLNIGDFDGDGKDEILGNDINGWTTLFKFDNNNWQWIWSDYGNQQHAIRPYKNMFYVGDFDGNGTDEILGCDLPNGWTSKFKFNGNDFIMDWSDYGLYNPIRPYRNNLIVGDFNGDGKDDIIGFDTWVTLFNFENSDWQWIWSNYGSNNFNGWGYPFQSTDKILVGNIDLDNKDELLFIETHATANLATSMDLKNDNSGWNWNWSTNSQNNIPFIYDWPLSASVGTNTKYFLIKVKQNKPNYLIAMRKFCNNYIVNLYSTNMISNYKTSKITNSNEDKNNLVKIVPNPSNGNITVTIKNETINKIEILNSTGQNIKSFDFNCTNNINIDFSNECSGLYIIKVTDCDYNITTEKLILNK